MSVQCINYALQPGVVTLIAPRSETRRALMFGSTFTDRVSVYTLPGQIAINGAISSDPGWTYRQLSPVIMTREQVGDLVTYPWYAQCNSSFAGGAITVWEIFDDGAIPPPQPMAEPMALEPNLCDKIAALAAALRGENVQA